MAVTKKNELKIRRAKSGDAPQIAELSGQLGYPATAAQVNERLRGIKPASEHAVLVAESAKDGVIGWLHVSKEPLLEVEIRAEVNGLVVVDGCRIASAQLQQFLSPELAREQAGVTVSCRQPPSKTSGDLVNP